MTFGTDILSWTSDDPRQSQLFASYGPLYRFVTETSARGQRTTTLYRTARPGKEERVARLEWAINGGLGRAIIGKSAVPMSDLVRPDPRDMSYRTFTGPDGLTYRWRPKGGSSPDVVLQDPYGSAIALVRPVRPTRYSIGDVYAELHLLNGNTGGMMGPSLMDTVTVTAMLYRFCMAYGL